MAQQTAVEWLEEELADNLKVIILNNDYQLMEKLFIQAKAMEKEQLIKTYISACESVTEYGYYGHSAEQYYNETYESNKD
jgi:hypothetical protein